MHICNGAILNTNYILTASDCVRDKLPSDLRVRLGHTEKFTGDIAGVCQVKIHPQSSKTKQGSNLALLKLCEPLDPSEDIQKIPIFYKQPKNGAEAFISGYGSYNNSYYTCQPHILRKKSVQLYDLRACAARRKISAPTISVTGLNICAEKKQRLCSFNKGAPLVIDGKLAGILSFGDCSIEPDVFVNVFYHIKWLQANTK
ncbi:trypsin-like [Drosophila subpulchrella]|uniref:trypsin-like n=1 Tax=Drosophila subpulchrella TaxID=1486046 RepID=UPI0018A1335F|nr:trypsin-like [Drosophila subpulchrella]XP_037731356.1 trypsin-like [Drosophila subpulchrella]XP_037731376.1 trypsin-like [Drosophila subpulchrella]